MCKVGAAVTAYHTVQKLIIINNQFSRTYNSSLSSNAYTKSLAHADFSGAVSNFHYISEGVVADLINANFCQI
jgi:hypothetical protein